MGDRSQLTICLCTIICHHHLEWSVIVGGREGLVLKAYARWWGVYILMFVESSYTVCHQQGNCSYKTKIDFFKSEHEPEDQL